MLPAELTFYVPSGKIEFLLNWYDFLSKVPREILHSTYSDLNYVEHMVIPDIYPSVSKINNPIFKRKTYKLIEDKEISPNDLFDAIKKGTTLVKLKNVTSIAELVHEMSTQSLINFGNPQYILYGNNGTWYLLNPEDYKICSYKNKSTLIALNPKKNIRCKY